MKHGQTVLNIILATKPLTERNDTRLRELENKLRFGTNGGLAGFDDSPMKRVCPGMGQTN